MKRVYTLRKVLRSLSKVLLEKLFYRSYIVAFIATQFLLFLSYLQPGDFSCCNAAPQKVDTERWKTDGK